MSAENVELADGAWRLWSQFALRGPGFPASGVLRLAPEGLADEAACFASAEPLVGERWQVFEDRFNAAALA
ncbi:MAG TPA: hypothetical protein VFU73_00415, partial [Actinocrinis sp.]|nr:hypothetical protein [Actinocrinis sp.]